MEDKKKKILGIVVKKEEDLSAWYTEILRKADLIEYTSVSGCIVIKPRAYYIWETLQNFIDNEIKREGVRNAYFPLFIPLSLLEKEKEHIEGFEPEVAWVTEAGGSKLAEKLAIRPTSETIMYDNYRKWIRSYKDLPLKLNQWCNVVRWEFKHPTPFLRTREFLWQEGHNAFSNDKECEEDTLWALSMYQKVLEEVLAVPVIPGRKSEKEKFAGAVYTLSLETFFDDGKAIQVATSHFLGQNFSKQFDIIFTDKDQEKKFVWQNSWGFTTRNIGIMIMLHSDNKGLVLPPKVAENKIVIVPVYNKDNKDKVIKMCEYLRDKILEFNPYLDLRDYSYGFKLNDSELKGYPLRIVVGEKEVNENRVAVVKRNNFEKIELKVDDEIKNNIGRILETMHNEMFKNAKKKLDEKIKVCETEGDLKRALRNKEWPLVKWCGDPECESLLKEKYGVKSNNIPFEQPKKAEGKCPFCKRDAKCYALICKSY